MYVLYRTAAYFYTGEAISSFLRMFPVSSDFALLSFEIVVERYSTLHKKGVFVESSLLIALAFTLGVSSN